MSMVIYLPVVLMLLAKAYVNHQSERAITVATGTCTLNRYARIADVF
jgi:hypothetical protein